MKRTALSVSVALALAACSAEPSLPDPFCRQEALPPGAQVKAGQGALLVEGKTNAHFVALDDAGKELGYNAIGKALALAPGKYRVRVNNSIHATTVQKGSLTTCTTATLVAAGTTTEHYTVRDASGKELSYNTLGKPLSLFPAALRVRVNNTEAAVEPKPGEATGIKTGTLLVHGGTTEHYTVQDALGKELAYNTLGKPLAFFPGSYVVKVNKTEARADVAAGELRELATGTVLAKGGTSEHYTVIDAAGNELAYNSLNKPLAFFPGSFRIRLNKTEIEAKVAARELSAYQAGAVLVTGNGSAHYEVLDKAGNGLSYASLNKPLSVFPGEYMVKLGESSRPASVAAGQTTSLAF